MTYQEFKDKYNGKFIDYDGQWGCQCWDLGEVYFTEVLGLPSSVLAGCGYVSNMLYPPKRNVLDQYFDEIDPVTAQQGDVAIWEEAHIAVVDSNDNGKLMYFSQNPNPCQVMAITNYGLHVFRLKGVEPEPPKPEPTNDIQVGDWVEPIEPVNYYGTPLTQYDPEYKVIELNGDRAVLAAPRDGKMAVWASMNVNNLKKVEE